MKNISYVRYSPTANSDELSAKVVKCYRKVFADGPWHEWLQCPVCKRYWGKKDENLLQELNFQHCGTGLIDFWSEEQVAKDILQYSNKISVLN